MNGCSCFLASLAARCTGMDSPGNPAYALLSRRGVDTAGREMPQKSRWESRYTEKSIVYGREACGGACPAWIATENTREGKSTALLYSSAVLLCPNTKGKKLKKHPFFLGTAVF